MSPTAAPLPPLPPTAAPPAGAVVGESMKDFKYSDSLVFPKNTPGAEEIQNVTQVGPRTFNFTLRHRGNPWATNNPKGVRGAWYDGDRDLQWNEGKHEGNVGKYKDKSRAELSCLKGLNAPFAVGTTWLIGTTVRLDPAFRPAAGYCNLMQPVGHQSFFTMHAIKGDTVTATLRVFENGIGSRQIDVRTVKLKRGEWTTLVIRVKIAQDGEYALSVNGDEFQGKKGLDTTRGHTRGPPFGGTWGLYGSGTWDVDRKPLNDSTLQHSNMFLKKL